VRVSREEILDCRLAETLRRRRDPEAIRRKADPVQPQLQQRARLPRRNVRQALVPWVLQRR
jgi:hypothetical protein